MPNLTESEKAILQVVVSLTDPSERVKYVQQACGSNSEMLRQMQRLLAADEVADGFLRPPVDFLDVADDDELLASPRERIGKYKLLQKIGEGGFGVVYMAEQQEPVARKVAIKVIKLGMDTKQVIARFEAERQALSMMDHPNIAKVFDGGATETGRPFFVMELIRGVSIMKYCDQEQLTYRQRLLLFQDICGAVQHAHQKGIVHRDLKPSNILITRHDGRPVPKVIDFGIAKAIQGRLTEKTLFTRFEHFIGTPAYMSPEQAEMSGLDIDTRSDIYSLGVLLYELLTGQIPFDTDEPNVGYDAICKRIREQEPPTPSTLLSSLQHETLSKVALNRQSDPENLPSLLQGDLDWIVMKAMEKDRTRRYETAAGFAEDIDRHLRHVPVRAVPPSKMYRFQKFVRRNQAAITLVATIAVILILAATISMWQAIRAVKAEKEQGRLLVVAEQQSQAAQEAAKLAEAGKLLARQVAYASDMVGADYALKLNNLGRARRLLDRNRPAVGETDLRNWEWRALWHRCRSDARSTFSDTEYQISSVSVSPNAKWLATVQAGGEIRVWDIQLEKTAAVLFPRFPDGSLRGQVVFASKGDLVFALAGYDTVRGWETGSWSETDKKFPHGARIESFALSQDGSLLAIIGYDEMISLWDVETQSERGRFPSVKRSDLKARIVAISPNNQWIAIGLDDGSIRMVDLVTHEEVFHFPTTVEGERVKTLAFSPDSTILACGTELANTTINLWSVGERKLIDRLEGHTRYIHSLDFSPDGRFLASASADQTIRVWNTETWKDPAVLRGHKQEVWALAFSADSDFLASGCKDGEICIWKTDRHPNTSWPISLPNELLFANSDFESQGRVSFSQDGQWLATLNKESMVSLRFAHNLEEIHLLAELESKNTGLLFSRHNNLLVIGDENGHLTWIDPLHPKEKKRDRISQSAKIFPMSFSSDGKQLLVLAEGEAGFRCILWSLIMGKETCSWDLPINTECAALSPDGSQVATGHRNGTIRFWQVADPREPTVVNHRKFVSGVAFSPDGKLLASGTWFGEAKIWDVATRSPMYNLHGHLTGIHAVEFSPDGKRLATAGSAGESVKLWDLATRQEVATLNAPGFTFGKVEFSPDGNAILVTSFHDSLSMWRVPSFEEIQTTER